MTILRSGLGVRAIAAVVTSVSVGVVGSACAPGDSGTSAVVRDSAGITIVEHPDLPTEAMGPWTIGPLELEIGQRDGAPEYSFASVVDARQLPDGRVVVAEGNDRTLRMYASDGTHQRTFGGEGGGPGEFGFLSAISWVDEREVWAWDARNQRLTRFTLGGDLVATNTSSAEAFDRALEMYRMPGGGYVARSNWVNPVTGGAEQYDLRLWVDSMVARHLADDGSVLDTIAIVAESEAFEESTQPEPGVFRTRTMRRIAGRWGHFARTPEGVVTGWNESYEFARWSSVIERELLVRVALEPEVLGEAEKMEVFRNFMLALGVAAEEIDPSVLGEMTIPDTAPQFSAIAAAETGEVWVADYALPGASVEWWTIFSLEGLIEGRIRLPPDFVIHQIGQDYVLGVGRDELDVPYVRRYALVRSSP